MITLAPANWLPVQQRDHSERFKSELIAHLAPRAEKALSVLPNSAHAGANHAAKHGADRQHNNAVRRTRSAGVRRFRDNPRLSQRHRKVLQARLVLLQDLFILRLEGRRFKFELA